MASVIAGALPMASQAFNLSSRLSFYRSEVLGVSLSTTPVSLSIPAATSPYTVPPIFCGRGDKKTAKGKRFNHSYGNARPRNKNKGRGPPRVPVPASPHKKDALEDIEFVDIDIEDESELSE